MRIGIDTNILLRIFTEDNNEQLKEIQDYIDENKEDTFVITPIILCEFIWTLRSVYKYSKQELISALKTIISNKLFYILQYKQVHFAIALYQDNNIDFSDAFAGYIYQHAKCPVSITFDKQAAKTHLFYTIKELEEIEDNYFSQLVDERMNKEGKFISHEEVWKTIKQ